jgi:O-antigen/teichoic acid export membrane protein
MGFLAHDTKLTKIFSISSISFFLYHLFRSYSAPYSLITIAQAGTRLLVFIGVAKLLGPEEYALWPLVQAIMSYSMLIGFGVMPALGNELPVHRGAGRVRKYNILLGSSLIFLSVFWVLITFVAIGIIIYNFDNRFYAYGAFLALFQSIIQFFTKIHRANLDFKKLFWSTFWSVIFLPFGTIFLVKIPRLDLFSIVFALSLLIQLAWLFDFKSLKEAKFKGYRSTFKIVFHLHKIGIPLLASVSLAALLFSIDRWFVNYFFTRAQLGQYGFAVFGAMGINLLITSVGQIYYPTIAHGYGASNRLSSLGKDIFLFLSFSVSLILMLIIAVWFLLPPIVTRWLPDYQEGLNAAQWMVLGGVALPFATLSSILLRVKRILWPLVTGQTIGLLIGACAIYYGCQQGTLISVGISVSLSYVAYSFIVVCIFILCFWTSVSENISRLFLFTNKL